jgi:hypothetical protein
MTWPGHLGGEVQAIHLLDPGIVERARLDHRPGAAQDLLGGLEDEHRRARHLRPPRGEDLGEGDGDGGGSWPQAAYHAGVGREGRVEDLGEGQGVDVGAPADGAAGPVAVQDADHAGAGEPGAHLELGCLEPLGDDLRRPPLLEDVRCRW